MKPQHKKALKITSLTLAVLMLLGALSGFGYYSYLTNKLDDGLEKGSVDALNTDAQNTDKPDLPNNQENILIVGSDSRYDNNGEGSPESNKGRRADTMMIMTLSADRKTITGVSLPRDLMVEDPPTCRKWDAKTREMSDIEQDFPNPAQLNSAFNTGGPACSVLFAEKVSNMHITRYIEIDFNGFKGIIDALGGLEITVDEPMIDSNVGTIFAEPGTYTVDGQKALDFVRARKVEGESGSDLSRIERQQYLVQEIVKQKITPQTLANPSKVNNLIEAFTENTSTDNINSQFLSDLAFDVKGVGVNEIMMHSLPTAPYTPDPNRLAMNEPKAEWLFDQIKDNKKVTDKELENWEEQ